jgi:hypothetical protein
MNDKHADYTADRLNHLRRAKDRSRQAGWALTMLAVALATVFVFALLDYWLLLPSGWRAGGLLWLTALLALGMLRLIHLLRRPSTAKAVALELEARRPELGCVVSTAAEYLPGGRDAAQAYEPELVAALHEQAARKLLVTEAPWWRKHLFTRLSMALGAAGLLAFLAAFTPGGGTALTRTLWPWSQAAYTRIEVRPGNHEVPEGTDQEIEARFIGRPPREARLEWRKISDADWRSDAMRPLGSRRFVATLLATKGDVRYRVSGRETRSPEFTLASFVPPELTGVRVRVEMPAYTKEAPREEESPNLSVLRGSRLEFRFTTSGDLTNAHLRFADQPSIPLTRVDGNRWTASLTASRDTYYWVALADVKGRKGGNEKPFKLTVLPDEKPTVDIVEPGLDIRAEPTAKVRLAINANDDYGIHDLRLVFRKMTGEWQTNRVALPAAENKEAAPMTELDLSPLHLKEYEVAAYYAEARDNNPLDGPGVGRSPVYFVEYTTKDQVLGQCRGNGTKVNLLELEKQIIAATTALPDAGEESKFRDLAGAQRQTRSFALIYKDGFHLAIAPPRARAEFAAALEAMGHASDLLDARSRAPALKNEESALQHLYEACRLLPELEAGMCKGEGNCMKIVLEAIEELKERQKKDRREGLPQAIAQARRLSELQQRLNDLYRRQQSPTNAPRSEPNVLISGSTSAPGHSQVAHTNSPPRRGTGPVSGEFTEPQDGAEGFAGHPQPRPSSRTAKRTNDIEGLGEVKSAGGNRLARLGAGEQSIAPVHPEGDGGREKAADQERQGDGENDSNLPAPGLSEEQRKLAEAAAALAQKLADLAGKDARVTFRYSEMVMQTSDLWSQASRSLANDQTRAAGEYGALGISLMRKVLSALEVIYGDDSPVGEFAAEDYPKEFEAQIADYLKRLSYAQ